MIYIIHRSLALFLTGAAQKNTSNTIWRPWPYVLPDGLPLFENPKAENRLDLLGLEKKTQKKKKRKHYKFFITIHKI